MRLPRKAVQARVFLVSRLQRRAGFYSPVLGQVLKVLVATGYVLEAVVQLYTPSALTMVMADPVMEATTRAT